GTHRRRRRQDGVVHGARDRAGRPGLQRIGGGRRPALVRRRVRVLAECHAGVHSGVAKSRRGRGESVALQALGSMDSPAATILVVEDHCATRTFLADNFAADGYDVIEAEGVSEARHLLARAFPDLAIVDLGLADGDGLELLTEVRTADRTAGRLDPDL